MKKDVAFNGMPPSKARSRAEEAFSALDLSLPREPMKRLTIEIEMFHRQ